MKSKTGITAATIPYRKAAGPALNDLLGGHIDAELFDAMPVMANQVKVNRHCHGAGGDQHPALPSALARTCRTVM